MDRLLDVSRPGGYPWCAEEIEIIEKRADYLNGLLDGLGLPQGSCVFLHYPARTPFSGKLLTYIVPASEGWLDLAPHGELFMLEINDNVDITTLLNGTSLHRNITIAEQSHHVYGTQAGEWLDCYKTRTATLCEGSAYKFYYLRNLLRPAVWTDLTLQDHVFRQGQNGYAIQAVIGLRAGYTPIVRKSDFEIEVNLAYEIPQGSSEGNVVLIHKFESGQNPGFNGKRYFLNVVNTDEDTGAVTMFGFITDTGIQFRLPETVVGRFVYVFGRVSLK